MSDLLKPYPDYRDSGLPWLGRAPAHWPLVRMKNLFAERVQKGFPDEPLLAATQTKGVVRKEDYGNRTVTAQKDFHLLKLVEVGDFVISLRSFEGGLEEAHCRGIISPAYTILTPRTGVTNGYFRHFFKSPDFIRSLTLFVTGIREGQNVDYDKLSRSPMPIPPPEEQVAIAKYLDHTERRIRRYITAKRRLIALLAEQKQAVIHRAVTRGLDPAAPLRPSGIPWLGDIPAHWELKRAKYLFKQVSLPMPDNAEQVTCFRDGQVTLRSNRRTTGFTNAILEQGYQGIEPGQLVLHSMDAFAGAIGVSDSRGKCSPEYVICEAAMPAISTHYYAILLRTLALKGMFVVLCPSVRQRAPRVRFSDFSAFNLPLVPIKEQESIIELIEKETSALDAAIATARREIDLLWEYRTRLIADVVTGKLDVRAAAAALPDLPAADLPPDALDPESDAEDPAESEAEPVDAEA